MYKKAFTLIETLFALAIVVAVLGISVQQNRSILYGSRLTEENIQMSGLIDDAENNLRNLQSQLLTSSPVLQLGDATNGLNVPPGSTNEIIMYTPSTVVDHTSPLTLLWCTKTSTNGCLNEISPIQTSNGQETIGSQFTNSDMQGELLAINKLRVSVVGGTTTASRKRLEVGMTARYASDLSPTCSSPSPCVNTTSSSTKSNWDLYIRKIKVTHLATTDSGILTYSESLANVNAASTARLSTYIVTVTVSSYTDPAISPVQRTFILTDWK